MSESKFLYELEDDGTLTLGRGLVISDKDIENYPGDYPVYSSSAKGNGEFGKYGKYMFNDERITWSIDGGGKLFYRSPSKYSVTNVCGWLKVNSKDLLTKYVYYALLYQWKNRVFDYTYKAHPSVIRKIYKISKIALNDQKQIIDILSSLEDNIEKLNSLMPLYDELIKSRFNCQRYCQ